MIFYKSIKTLKGSANFPNTLCTFCIYWYILKWFLQAFSRMGISGRLFKYSVNGTFWFLPRLSIGTCTVWSYLKSQIAARFCWTVENFGMFLRLFNVFVSSVSVPFALFLRNFVVCLVWLVLWKICFHTLFQESADIRRYSYDVLGQSWMHGNFYFLFHHLYCVSICIDVIKSQISLWKCFKCSGYWLLLHTRKRSFVSYMLLSLGPIQMLEQELRLNRSGNIFPTWWALTNCSLSFPFFADVSDTQCVIFCY